MTTQCPPNPPFYHLGGRFYLSTKQRVLQATRNSTSYPLTLSPLMVFHLPCDVRFPAQETGFGPCPSTLRINVPIFSEDNFAYVPWQSAKDNSVLTMHYESNRIPPPLKFNISTLHSLDSTFDSLDGRLGRTLSKVRQVINHMKETYTTTLNDILTFVSFSLAVLCLLLQIVGCCFLCRRHRDYFPPQPVPILSYPVKEHLEIPLAESQILNDKGTHIELQELPTCGGCHKPKYPDQAE